MNILRDKICPKCNKGELKKVIAHYKVNKLKLGNFQAFACNLCNEKWLNEKTSRKIEKLEKKNNLFNTDGFGILKGKKLKPFVREHNCLDREFQ